MFTQVETSREKSLRSSGRLELIPRDVRKGLSNLQIAVANDDKDYEVVYVSYNAMMFPSPIFSCKLILVCKTLALSDLWYPLDSIHNSSESYMYMFLNWVFEEGVSWARRFGKEKILITTRLPHCTELFVENGYSVRPMSTFDLDNFVGTKNITKGVKPKLNERSKN